MATEELYEVGRAEPNRSGSIQTNFETCRVTRREQHQSSIKATARAQAGGLPVPDLGGGGGSDRSSGKNTPIRFCRFGSGWKLRFDECFRFHQTQNLWMQSLLNFVSSVWWGGPGGFGLLFSCQTQIIFVCAIKFLNNPELVDNHW